MMKNKLIVLIVLISFIFSNTYAGVVKNTAKKVLFLGAVYGVKKGAEYYLKKKAKKSSKGTFSRNVVENKHAPDGKRIVYQREIDPDYTPTVFNSKTKEEEVISNRNRMKSGKTPYISSNGKPIKVELHHSRQSSEGSLFEINERAHDSLTKKGREALHPYSSKRGRKINKIKNKDKKTMSKHPDYPIIGEKRKKFNNERRTYWMNRIKEIDIKG